MGSKYDFYQVMPPFCENGVYNVQKIITLFKSTWEIGGSL
jgi:hypothetical protein